MKNKLNENAYNSIFVLSTSGIIIVTFALLARNIPAIMNVISKVWSILMPFIIGFSVAFVLSPLQKGFESYFKNTLHFKSKNARKASVLVALSSLILFVALFFSILIPQLYQSSLLLIETVQYAVENFSINPDWIQNAFVQNFLTNFIVDSERYLTNLLASVSAYIPSLISYSYKLVSQLINFFIGFIIAFYILVDKEKFKRQAEMVHFAFVPTKYAIEIAEIVSLLGKMFNEFIFGKAVDSLIVAAICAVCMYILRIPYIPLISFVIGITNMIPVFGPFIGAVPSIFILVILNPVKALEFAIFVIVLQQIDGNIIGPRILGESMGLPTLWIMFAIIVGGGTFGIIGMFVGVPIFATIYITLQTIIKRRLDEKHIIIGDDNTL